MSDIYFYQLTRSPIENTLGELLPKCLQKGWRVLVRGTDTKKLVWLDEKLWTTGKNSFLPHGFMTGANDAHQPILLTEADVNTNQADVLMLVDGAKTNPEEISKFSRTCLIFNGNNPDSLTAARADWKTFTTQGTPAQYWSQESGKWELKAKSS